MNKKEATEPFSAWTEEELLDGKRARCLTIILSTSGCSWWRSSGGCSMCGYNYKSPRKETSSESIVRQFDNAWRMFDAHSMIKIYTSGSFLDENEVPSDARKHILDVVGRSGAKLLFESRPEFVSAEVIAECKELCPEIELALGLESANDKVLEHAIRKGFSFSDYLRAATEGKKAGADIRTYLLLKPPYLTEIEAIADVKSSITKVSDISKVISINPVNVQRGTRVEQMWRSWSYRPPWLWSVVEILGNSKPEDSLLIASTVAAGSERGAHNCSKCDRDFVQAIEGFNLTQDRKNLGTLECECRSRWEKYLEIEEFSVATTDLERYFLR
ncbi:MAG: archaeosine biosynthesis radical SAM protein RaSEA [Thermoplasmata archaeon]